MSVQFLCHRRKFKLSSVSVNAEWLAVKRDTSIMVAKYFSKHVILMLERWEYDRVSTRLKIFLIERHGEE